MDFFQRVHEEVNAVPINRRPSPWISALYLVFITCTTPYTFITEIIPFHFRDYSNLTVSCLNFLMVFGCLEVLANYFCVRYYKSYAIGTSALSAEIQAKKSQYADIRQAPGYCSKCNWLSSKSSGTHHCKVCNRCILRRDHHCYVLGTCIGYYNQRFFIVLSFYTGFGSLICIFYLWKYFLFLRSEPNFDWTDYFPPATVVRWYFGRISITRLLAVIQGFTFLITTVLGVGFFVIQLIVVSTGLTAHEYMKAQFPLKGLQHSTTSHNFRLVFGKFWLLNFLLPMQLIFKQKPLENSYIVPLSIFDSEFV